MNPIEQRLRKELAACYRLIAHFRMWYLERKRLYA